MGYDKGRLSREQIVEACAAVIVARGFAAPSTSDLILAAGTSAGRLTHHFPTKDSLFEAVFEHLLASFEAGPISSLVDKNSSPSERIESFLDQLLGIYLSQGASIGCPLGHAAADVDSVSATLRDQAFKVLRKIESLLERNLRELGLPVARASSMAAVLVSGWQGAVIVARAGGGARHLREVFRGLKGLVFEPVAAASSR